MRDGWGCLALRPGEARGSSLWGPPALACDQIISAHLSLASLACPSSPQIRSAQLSSAQIVSLSVAQLNSAQRSLAQVSLA